MGGAICCRKGGELVAQEAFPVDPVPSPALQKFSDKHVLRRREPVVIHIEVLSDVNLV
jgi:hypothetical protein